MIPTTAGSAMTLTPLATARAVSVRVVRPRSGVRTRDGVEDKGGGEGGAGAVGVGLGARTKTRAGSRLIDSETKLGIEVKG